MMQVVSRYIVRARVRSGLCISALVVSLSTLAACANFGGNESSSSSGIIKQLWSVDVDQRELGEPEGYSYPAVVGSGDEELIVIGGRDGRIRILNSHGREQHLITINEPSDSPALVLPNGTVVVGDVGGMLYGIDPHQGTIVWQYQLSTLFLAPPVLLGDGFLVQTMDNRIYHFSSTGNKQWSYAGHGGGLSLYMTASPLVVDQTVYAAFTNGDAVALKASSGDLLWRRQLLLNTDAAVLSELRTPVASPIHLERAFIGAEQADDVLVVAFYQGSILVLARDDGRQLFAKEMSIKSTPLIAGDLLYFATSSGEVEAVNLVAGTTVWKSKVSDGELLGPVLWNDSLWLTDDRGIVIRLSKDGRKQASKTLQGRIERAPVATSSGVLARTGRGVLTLLR